MSCRRRRSIGVMLIAASRAHVASISAIAANNVSSCAEVAFATVAPRRGLTSIRPVEASCRKRFAHRRSRHAVALRQACLRRDGGPAETRQTRQIPRSLRQVAPSASRPRIPPASMRHPNQFRSLVFVQQVAYNISMQNYNISIQFRISACILTTVHADIARALHASVCTLSR